MTWARWTDGWKARVWCIAALVSLTSVVLPAPAEAQLGNLISPGGLSRAHANLEGIANCQQCHQQGRGVTAGKCLACHKPIAERMTRRTGVHRDVKEDCIACHVEHAGPGGELRPFDERRFEHARVTGFPLDGRHAGLASGCAACHKGRSFLTARPDCASCHTDVHKGSLGKACATCHSTQVAFKESSRSFDHSKTAFALVGAHRTVACASCHVKQVFKGLAFSTCSSCHTDPHRPTFGTTCTNCHTSTSWRTKQFDHARTRFPLVGLHQKTECASCHKQSATSVKLKSDTCATCHVDTHRGEFRQDCKACHTESGFGKGRFDHSTTTFALTGKHAAPLECAACHKAVGRQSALPVAKRVADFRGASTACVSCHADVHQKQLGGACESCHTTASFRLPGYTHPRFAEFFGGEHRTVTCDKCHVPQAPSQPIRTGAPIVVAVRYRNVSTTCAACHQDTHLGQLGSTCETCHTVQQAKFAVVGFPHAKTAFPLTGRHETAECVTCHTRESGIFPSGWGTARRWKGVAKDCVACHKDVHLGQVDRACETCHTTSAFTIAKYRHRNRALLDFFVGAHVVAPCDTCHKTVTRQFPSGRGTAINFKVGTTCVACHQDVHRGSLGPDCAMCHRP